MIIRTPHVQEGSLAPPSVSARFQVLDDYATLNLHLACTKIKAQARNQPLLLYVLVSLDSIIAKA